MLTYIPEWMEFVKTPPTFTIKIVLSLTLFKNAGFLQVGLKMQSDNTTPDNIFQISESDNVNASKVIVEQDAETKKQRNKKKTFPYQYWIPGLPSGNSKFILIGCKVFSTHVITEKLVLRYKNCLVSI